MLPLKNRLKKERDIKKVFRQGWGVKEESLLLKKIENSLKESRFCFVVPDSVSKKATIRNRLRRKMREIARNALPEIKKGFDVVLIALPGAEKKDFRQLKIELSRIFLKANLFK